jgi:hypothetical protein
MKNLSQFKEESDPKSSKKASDAEKAKKEKAHHAKQLEELNDKVYVALMDQYKQMRRHDRKSASKILEKARKLKNVSHRAKLGAAYL